MRQGWALIVLIWMATSAAAQDRPLKTESPDLVGLGVVRLDFGVEFLHRMHYSLSGLEGDLTRFGETIIRVGVGEYAEFQLSGVFRDFVTVTRRYPPAIPPTFAGDSTSDFGDLFLATKLKFAGEKGPRPAIGFMFAVKLPNASNESGLGTDTTDFFARVLASKHLGSTELTGNIGLAILGSAVQPNSQSDMLTYALGIAVPLTSRVELVGEVYGRQGPDRIGNETRSQAQLGIRFRAAGLRWNVGGIAGLERFNPGYGLSVGVTYEFQAFHKIRKPVTIRKGTRNAMPAGSR